jgi:hypothetical protein
MSRDKHHVAMVNPVIGQRYGRLVVLGSEMRERAGTDPAMHWKCACDCGNIRYHTANRLRERKSCGCAVHLNRPKTHGLTIGDQNRAYRAWSKMMSRCYNPKDQSYGRYGGAGIVVSDEWHSVVRFHADMGTPDAEQTLDRIKNNLGYSKQNCRWADRITQANNKKTTKLVIYHGAEYAVRELARKLGIDGKTLWTRLFRRGWEVDRAVSTPVQTAKTRARQNGKFT